MANAIALRDDYSCSGSGLTQNNLLTEDVVRQEWTAQVLPFSKHQLARLSGNSTQATNLWHRGERAPSSTSLLNIARALPSVQGWLAGRVGIHRGAQAGSLDEVLVALKAIASRNDAEAIVATQLLAVAYRLWLPAQPGRPRDISPEAVAKTILDMEKP